MQEGAPFTENMVGCARCHGEGHDGVEFKPFAHPVEIGELRFTHWAMCPTTNEPILVRATPIVFACKR